MQFTTTKRFAFAASALLVGGLAAAKLAYGAGTEDNVREAAKVRKGFAVAPVALNLSGKNPDLVGYGSYLVNVVGGCNDCHSAGIPFVFAPGGSPYFGQPKKLNPEGHLGGGTDFGPFPGLEHLYSRNLTPDKSGLPVGGMTYNEFVDVIRNGTDRKKIHPSCSATVKTGCVPPPFDGSKLQVMPWPLLQDLDNYDLLAIYQYLSAIPCVPGPADKDNILSNACK